MGSYSTFGLRSRSESLGFYCSFSGSTSHKSEKKKVFPGIGCGPKCVGKLHLIVKAFPIEESSEQRCDQEMEAAAEVRRLAKQFCKGRTGVHIIVEVPAKTQVEDLASGNDRKSRPLYENQHVLVENEVPGKFQQFTGEFGVCKNEDFSVLNNFAHYVYHVTGGEMVVCNLQGVSKEQRFHLVSPVLHSARQSYGPRDQGQEGIARFFQEHVCSEECQGWLTPKTLEGHLESKGRPPASSAPIDIKRGRAPLPQGGFAWPRPGGSDDFDFSPWSTVGPFGSPLSPPLHGFSPAPPYASPSLHGTGSFPLHYQMIGSPPPAYIFPSAPFEESDVWDTFEDKQYRPDLPPPYEEVCPGLQT